MMNSIGMVYTQRGYSGAPGHVNVPADEHLRNRGPIPRGRYRIVGVTNSRGADTIVLEPVGHNARGRTNFRVHGDSIRNPGSASEGCVVADPTIRRDMTGFVGGELIVVDEPEW